MTTRYPAHRALRSTGIRGQKPPLKRQQVWAIRIRLELDSRWRDLALFDMAIDSKLRACDLVSLRMADVAPGGRVVRRACVIQRKTGRPVQFEITHQARDSVANWIQYSGLGAGDYLYPSRLKARRHLSARQYARILKSWVAMIGLDPTDYGTHSMRRTKNLRAIQLLLGHTKLESTIRYLGIEVDDALELAEQTEV